MAGMTTKLRKCEVCDPLQFGPASLENTYPPYAFTPHPLLYNFTPSDKEKQKMLLRRLWLAAAWKIGHYKGFKVAILALFLTDFWTLNSGLGMAGLPTIVRKSLREVTQCIVGYHVFVIM
jgi:hypothetical protein